MLTSLTYLSTEGSGPAALRIVAPPSDSRTPTHFIALIDVSESMSDRSKLTHVKHCMSLLLRFLAPEDYVSLITFGNESQIVLNRVSAVAAQTPILEHAIESLQTDGCTNFSAGLGSVRQILEEASAAACPAKPGLLILTDGHANRGVCDSSTLQKAVERIHELYPTLSFSFVAYGTDHNASLMKTMTDAVLGSYSIVENMEGAAVAMGDSLGSIISCVAQNIVVEFPAGTTAHGPYTIDPRGRLVLGDLYAGSETMVLVEAAAGPVTVSGVTLPTLDPFRQEAAATLDTAPNTEIDVTRLRYRCANLFRQIRTALTSNSTDISHITSQVASFREALDDPRFVDHPVVAMLKTEFYSLSAALQNIHAGSSDRLISQLAQHEAFTSLLRGTTTTIVPEMTTPLRRTRAVAGGGRAQFRSIGSHASDTDPDCPSIPPPTAFCSPMSSTRQRDVTELMRAASQQPQPPTDDDEHTEDEA